MRELDVSPGRLVDWLLRLGGQVCLLDSCGVGKAGANMLIAGVEPVRTISLSDKDAEESLNELETLLSSNDLAAIFSISYDLGLKLNRITVDVKKSSSEPDIFAALFDTLILHDYNSGRTWLDGNSARFDAIEARLNGTTHSRTDAPNQIGHSVKQVSNFSRDKYVDSVSEIKDFIRQGDTYQTNLTQQLRVSLPEGTTPADVFKNLRRDHPAPFAAYIQRGDSVVVSASPEQFLRVESVAESRRITASPIKGTRRRGRNPAEDQKLRNELLSSEKDRAENTMIVDLMRNDLGRVCEFGSIEVDDLCRVEEHSTLFHLVSTVSGELRPEVGYADILHAVFPCGSITGAPKIRTMEIIDRLETVPRGLSMGAIGCRLPGDVFGTAEIFEMSVAIRTMTIRSGRAVFNVGGGVVIDSDPDAEYEESMLKAKALLRALGGNF